ncbi:MAG: hypothetical protein V1921_00090 [Candidatus Altiarchaeota archaeon]
MKSHKVALSGSYSGNIEKLFKSLGHEGVLQFSLIGRDITLQVKSEKLDDIKKSLSRLGVDNIGILEWKKYGMSLCNSGMGDDDETMIRVVLIPTALDEGIRCLAFLTPYSMSKEGEKKITARVEDILSKAGITDSLYTIQLKKESTVDKYLNAVETATLNALFESGGVVNIE